MSKPGTCETCKHWEAAHGIYVAACTSKKAGLGAVTQRSGSSAICRWDFAPRSHPSIKEEGE